jgi:hypothetical protein
MITRFIRLAKIEQREPGLSFCLGLLALQWAENYLALTVDA